VETPDSIFVSDLERSRDVKSIVTELKDRGRKEYQQHRSVYHPWGIITLLEQRDHYTAAELMVYPGSKLQLPDDKNRIQHLFVVKGEAWISDELHDETVAPGESFTRKFQGQVQIENKSEKEIYLIQVVLT
jgi:mannose-6-phosphate isomerase-like protein (cupin superfamily)